MSFALPGRGLLACALWLCASVAGAQTTEPSSQEALYQQALQWMAEGRNTQAREALLQLLALQPDHAGAWLDLAVLHCNMGLEKEAEALFAEVTQRFAPPPALREVIDTLRQQGCRRQAPSAKVRLRLGLGTDSNVNQGASNPAFTLGSGSSATPLVLAAEYTPRADQFGAGTLDWAAPVGAAGTLAYAQAQARQHQQYPQYDLGAVVLGLEQPWQLGAWAWRANGSLGLTTLGGVLYQRQAQLQVQALAPAPALLPAAWAPTGWMLGGSGGWAGSAYPTLSGFDSQVWELRAVLAYEQPGWLVQASAGYALDQGQAQRPGSDRSGAVAALSLRLPLAGQVSADMGLSVQGWQGQQVYAPGLIDERRQQLSTLLRLGLTVPLAEHQAMRLELRHARNDENISLFTYQGSQVQLSWEWQWPR